MALISKSIEERQQDAIKLDYLQVLKNRHAVIILTLLLVLITAVVISFLWPKRYEASAKVQINRFSHTVATTSDGSMVGPGEDPSSPRFLETQIEWLTAPETLRRVVESLDLSSAANWNMPEDLCVDRLAGGIKTRPQLGTDLVTISYRDEDKPTAKLIVADVIRAYEAGRVARELQRAESGLQTLMEQITRFEERTNTDRNEMDKVAKELGISNLPLDYQKSLATEAPSSPREFWRMQVLDLEKEVNKFQASVNRLQALEGDQVIDMAQSLGIADEAIVSLLPQYRELRLLDAQMGQQGLGPNHPNRRAVVSQVAELRTMLEGAAVQIKETLNVQLELSQRQLDAAREQLASEEGQSEDDIPKRIVFDQARDKYHQSMEMLMDLQTSYINQQTKMDMYRHPIEVQQQANVSNAPVEPNWTINLALGGLLGLALGVGLAFMLELSDTTVRSMEEVEAFLGVPVLAVIPKGVGDLIRQGGSSPDAEAYRILRTNMEFNRKDANANVATMVSGGAGEGKTTTIVNLAYVCAQGGYNTLLIDADLRRPRLHDKFEVDNNLGLTNFLTSDLALEDVVVQTPVDHLFLLPSGVLPQDASGLLNSRKMGLLLEDVRQRFDLVLIDSPPILGVSDASVIVREADLTILVVQHRKLPRKMLLRVQQVIENVGGNLLGVVLNNVDIHSDSQYQYYTSYYTYYSSDLSGQAASGGRKPARKGAGAAAPAAGEAQNSDLY